MAEFSYRIAHSFANCGGTTTRSVFTNIENGIIFRNITAKAPKEKGKQIVFLAADSKYDEIYTFETFAGNSTLVKTTRKHDADGIAATATLIDQSAAIFREINEFAQGNAANAPLPILTKIDIVRYMSKAIFVEGGKPVVAEFAKMKFGDGGEFYFCNVIYLGGGDLPPNFANARICRDPVSEYLTRRQIIAANKFKYYEPQKKIKEKFT